MNTAHKLPKFENVKTVFLDIDDTLWENNLFFLQSLEWLCGEGRNLGIPDRATITMLNHWETFNIRHKGFGYDSYESSLLLTVSMLARRAARLDSFSVGVPIASAFEAFSTNALIPPARRLCGVSGDSSRASFTTTYTDAASPAPVSTWIVA